jgi:hypothetical protein
MAATRSETAPSAKVAEAWSILPEEIAIFAPAPISKVMPVEWPNPTEDDPKGIIIVKVALIGANDAHDDTLPDFDHSFTWDVTSDKARAQIATYVTRGCNAVNVDGRFFKNVNVVANGRHRVLLARVANQIRVALGEKPCKVVMRRMVLPDGYASTYSLLANVSYDRDPVALGRQYAKAMAERNINAKELGAEIGKSEATVRRLVLLGEGKTKKTEQKRERAGLRKPQQKAFFEAMKRCGVSNEARMVAEVFLTGKLPDDAYPAVKAAWKAAQKD